MLSLVKKLFPILKPEHIDVNNMLLLLVTVIVVKYILLACSLGKNQIFFKQATLSIFSSKFSSYILIAEEVVP